MSSILEAKKMIAIVEATAKVPGSECAIWMGKRSFQFGYPIAFVAVHERKTAVVNVPSLVWSLAHGKPPGPPSVQLFENTCGVRGAYCVNPDHLTLVQTLPMDEYQRLTAEWRVNNPPPVWSRPQGTE